VSNFLNKLLELLPFIELTDFHWKRLSIVIVFIPQGNHSIIGDTLARLLLDYILAISQKGLRLFALRDTLSLLYSLPLLKRGFDSRWTFSIWQELGCWFSRHTLLFKQSHLTFLPMLLRKCHDRVPAIHKVFIVAFLQHAANLLTARKHNVVSMLMESLKDFSLIWIQLNVHQTFVHVHNLDIVLSEVNRVTGTLFQFVNMFLCKCNRFTRTFQERIAVKGRFLIDHSIFERLFLCHLPNSS